MRILTPSLVLLAMTAACTGDQPPPPAVTGPVHHVEVAPARAVVTAAVVRMED